MTELKIGDLIKIADENFEDAVCPECGSPNIERLSKYFARCQDCPELLNGFCYWRLGWQFVETREDKTEQSGMEAFV